MTGRKIKLLFAALLILISLIIFQLYIPSFWQSKRNTYQLKVSPDLKDVKFLELKKDKQLLSLRKEGDDWKLNGNKVSQIKIDDLLKPLSDYTSISLVAETASKHEVFQVASNSAAYLLINNTLNLLLGKEATDGLYVRVNEEDKVYLIKNLFLTNISLNADDWYDKTVLDTTGKK